MANVTEVMEKIGTFPPTLLVEMKDNAATVKNWTFLHKLKKKITICFSNSTLSIYPPKLKTDVETNMHMNLYSSTIAKSRKSNK